MKPTPPLKSDSLRRVWISTGGKAWEPRDVTSHAVAIMVQQGWVRFVDGRVGFERLKDAMLEWTPAGRFAMSAWDATAPPPSSAGEA